jgi:hypothetical protein
MWVRAAPFTPCGDAHKITPGESSSTVVLPPRALTVAALLTRWFMCVALLAAMAAHVLWRELVYE